VAVRSPAGAVCFRCYHADPDRFADCSRCGTRARVVARTDAGPVCPRCYRVPSRPCAGCGELRPVHYVSATGPVCRRCYQPPRRLCQRCGQLRAIVRRGRGAGDPGLCGNCWLGPVAACAACGRERPCQFPAGVPVCSSCRPRPVRYCAVCGQARPVHANWPLGPVCVRCYRRVRAEPHPCGQCQAVRPLIGASHHGDRVCGPCSGSGLAYSCRDCGAAGLLSGHGRCASCALHHRLNAVIGELAPPAAEQARVVFARLEARTSAEALLRSLRGGGLAQLGRLLHAAQPLTHELLDASPPSGSREHLRAMLVDAGMLPARPERLARIERWLEELLAGQPTSRARMLRAFATWHVLRRARRRARGEDVSTNADSGVRTRIRVALELTCWLAAQQRDLASATQADIDRWITAHPTRAPHARAFLAWARDHRLAGDVRIPARPATRPGQALPDRERWQILERCLHDDTLPLADRVAGALVLLYGQPLSHVVRLHSDAVQHSSGSTHLALGSCAIRLPSELAPLINRLAARARARPISAAGRPWLFPGLRPGEHLRPAALGARLRRLGAGHRTARNGALIALAAELPAPVLASLLGLHQNTAIRWTHYAEADWAAYLAARARTQPATPADRHHDH
jgi:hypothetical protein